jgi:hypothetical protein
MYLYALISNKPRSEMILANGPWPITKEQRKKHVHENINFSEKQINLQSAST